MCLIFKNTNVLIAYKTQFLVQIFGRTLMNILNPFWKERGSKNFKCLLHRRALHQGDPAGGAEMLLRWVPEDQRFQVETCDTLKALALREPSQFLEDFVIENLICDCKTTDLDLNSLILLLSTITHQLPIC